MEFSEFILRFIIGGFIISFISILAETEYRVLSGLFVLFPAITTVGYYFVSKSMSTQELQDMTIFSLISLPTLAIFFASFYITIQYYNIILSLIISMIIWLLSAVSTIMIDKYYLNLV